MKRQTRSSESECRKQQAQWSKCHHPTSHCPPPPNHRLSPHFAHGVPAKAIRRSRPRRCPAPCARSRWRASPAGRRGATRTRSERFGGFVALLVVGAAGCRLFEMTSGSCSEACFEDCFGGSHLRILVISKLALGGGLRLAVELGVSQEANHLRRGSLVGMSWRVLILRRKVGSFLK